MAGTPLIKPLQGRMVMLMKTLTLFVLLIATPHLGFAGIYRCEDAGGRVIFTDNPSNLPPGCQASYVDDMPDLNMVLPSSPQPVEQKAAAQPPAQIVEDIPPESIEDEYDILKEKAVDLVERFLSTRKRVYRSTGPRSRNKARRVLKEVRSQKQPLLIKVDKSTLSRSQKKTIREILAEITDE